MQSPQFLLSNYINKHKSNLENFKEDLYKSGVLVKDYEEDNLILIYNKFGKAKTTIEEECRSVVLDRTNLNIVSFTCNTPLCNKEAINFIMENNNPDKIITECYEGTLLSVFNHNDKWFVSTRRCLNSDNSIWQDNKSHYQLFVEVLKDQGYNSIDEFTSNLLSEYCYYFVLLHHRNKNVVDYTDVFGEEYKKLCLVIVREKETQSEVDLWNDINKVFNQNIIKNNIFIPKRLENLNLIDIENQKSNLSTPPRTEGLIVKILDKNNQYRVLKFQTNDYQFGSASGRENNIYRGFIKLYQNGELSKFFKDNKNFTNYCKIINPLNTSESYDTIGTVDAVFKVCTSELFELFKILWDIKTGKHKNTKLYDKLSKDYKDVLFGIRGIYFKKKASYIKEKLENSVSKNNYLKIKDIYTYLKTVNVETLEGLLRNRKLLNNWLKIDPTNEDIKDFNKISEKCDKVHYKLTAIYTNKLFPNIMPNDIPTYE